MTRFDEFEEGQVASSKTVDAVSAANIRTIAAIMQDPNPIHYDERYIDTEGLPGFVNQGAANMSYLWQAVLDIAETPAEVTQFSVRFEANVYQGEAVEATCVVSEVEKDRLHLDLHLEKGDGTTAATGTAIIGSK